MAVLRSLGWALVLPLAVTVISAQDNAPPEMSSGLLIEALANPDLSIRQHAKTLLQEKGAAAVPALVAVLRHDPLPRSVSAASVLAELGTHANLKKWQIPNDELPAWQRLQQALSDQRGELVEILEQVGTENWRWNITAEVLARAAPHRPEELPLFIDRLGSTSPLVQYPSLLAITTTLRSAAGVVEDANAYDDRDKYLQQLHKAGIEDQLLVDARRNLLRLFSRRRMPFTRILIDRVGNVSGQVMFQAETPWIDDFVITDCLYWCGLEHDRLYSLLASKTSADMGGASRYITDVPPSAVTQLSAAGQLMRLGRHGIELAAGTLSALIGNRHSRARPDAVTMAGKLGPSGASAAPALAGVLIDQDKNLRRTAAMALGKMGPAARAQLPRLESALAMEEVRLPGGQDVIEAMRVAIDEISPPDDAGSDPDGPATPTAPPEQALPANG